jgi:hypothetical protein
MRLGCQVAYLREGEPMLQLKIKKGQIKYQIKDQIQDLRTDYYCICQKLQKSGGN